MHLSTKKIMYWSKHCVVKGLIIFTFCVTALHTGLYRLVGTMISVCLIHGGVAPHFFSDRLYNQISGKPTGPASMADIGDQQVNERLQKVRTLSVLPTNLRIKNERFCLRSADTSSLNINLIKFLLWNALMPLLILVKKVCKYSLMPHLCSSVLFVSVTFQKLLEFAKKM